MHLPTRAPGIIPAYAGSTPTAVARQRQQQDHPRIRGEHFVRGLLLSRNRGSSPHTRGARLRVAEALFGHRIIPAYAGSTEANSLDGQTMADHPRIRGEHQTPVRRSLRPGGSSPHTRGAPTISTYGAGTRGIIPAYAGSTSSVCIYCRTLPDHPRIRGEHSAPSGRGATSTGSSPHTRGARDRYPRSACRERIIPAYAGSTPWRSRPPLRTRDHPRIRGEHGHTQSLRRLRDGSSPHTRGALDRVGRNLHDVGIIPAYAGSTHCPGSGAAEDRDHPRIRGEHGIRRHRHHRTAGSSPHTRGAHEDPVAAPSDGAIIPAYAGSTPAPPSTGPTRRDHPRIRGEHSPALMPMEGRSGSSPHTRGALAAGSAEARPERIIPAYAGSTPDSAVYRTDLHGSSPHTRGAPHGSSMRNSLPRIIPAYAGSTSCRSPAPRSLADHPRIRGEHQRDGFGRVDLAGSSPHTRGARPILAPAGRRPRIIPAYAGSTRPAHRQAPRPPDHPRIRGEHAQGRRRMARIGGSSPHTRGAHQRAPVWARHHGIIPAYAGSTSQMTCVSTWTADHPRIRGEHLAPPRHERRGFGSSPHTRGAHQNQCDSRHEAGIIPAYAGSTGSTCGRRRPRWIIPAYAGSTSGGFLMLSGVWDHPRIRGEHVAYRLLMIVESGSSPHTRGARRPPASQSPERRIIPAYAGSTG